MLKRIALVAALVACTGEDDVTRVTATLAPDGAQGNGVASGAAPSSVRAASMAARAGAPRFAWARPATANTRSIAAPALSVEQAARAQLAAVATDHAYSPRQLAQLELTELHDTGTGAIIARFQRRIEGIEVFAQGISVALDRQLGALALSGDVTGDVSTLPKATAAPLASQFSLSPEQAVISAVADLTGIELQAGDLDASQSLPGGYEQIPLGAEAQALLAAEAGTSAARAKPVLFPGAGDELLPAYYVETDVGADTAGRPRCFSQVVSAADGSVLWQQDLTASDGYSYRVYADAAGLFTPWDGPQGTSPSPHPSGEPDGFEPSFVSPNLISLSSLEAVGVSDPWLPPGSRETVGNNVYAYADLAAPQGFTLGTDLQGQTSAPGVFDIPFDPTLDASVDTDQQVAAITQLFYDVNWFHDWYYAAGFTELAGNAQLSNYGRGGLQGDGLLAETQDWSGTNNAFTTTPADGASPRIQMFLFTDFSSLNVTGPEAIAGPYTTRTAVFTPSRFDASGPIVRAEPVDGCAPLVGTYTGSIVLIDRGGTDCGAEAIVTKATHAQQAGALGAIVANVSTSANPTVALAALGTPTLPITIGLLTLNLADGDRLRAALARGEHVEGSLQRDDRRRDSAVDNQIVAHEWGHYISNRLIYNAAGLHNKMGSSLGEGWGDFHSLLMTVRAEDAKNPANLNWDGAYAPGAYSTLGHRANAYYFGGRRYPYSTDLSKDPLTFQHISNAAALPAAVPQSFDADHTEVHRAGEVWATMLWECYASLLRDTLGSTPRLTFAEARDRMRDYLVASYKLVPQSPTLLEARDALLAAAAARDAVDLEHFSRAFAKRGAGVFAVAPQRFDETNGGVVESYAAGAALQVTTASLSDDVQAVCIPDGILDDGETGTLHLTFENVGNVPSDAASAIVSGSVAGVTFPDGASVAIPRLPVFGTAEAQVRVALAGLSGVTPIEFSMQLPDVGAGTPPPASYGFLTNADEVPGQSFTDSAESSHVVWIGNRSSDGIPEQSRWQRVAASATDHYYRGASSPIPASILLQSPALDVLPGAELELSFQHRFDFAVDSNGNRIDGGVIELSLDGGTTWIDVGTDRASYSGTLLSGTPNPLSNRAAFSGTSAGYPAFTQQTLALGNAFGGQSVLLRFHVGSAGGTVTAGWDLDEITISGVATPPFDTIVPQPESCAEAPPAAAPVPLVVP